MLPHEGNAPGIVTVSVGCATVIPQRGKTARDLIESSDQALYLAKARGRNRVIVAGAARARADAESSESFEEEAPGVRFFGEPS